MATFDEDALYKRHRVMVRRDPRWIQFESEYFRLKEEVKQLEKQKNEAKDEGERKVIEKKIAMRDLADLKLRNDMLLQEIKTSTSDVMKSEIEEAEGGIHCWKDEDSKVQGAAKWLLKNEGEDLSELKRYVLEVENVDAPRFLPYFRLRFMLDQRECDRCAVATMLPSNCLSHVV